MRKNSHYPAPVLTKQDPVGKKFTDGRLRVALADVLAKAPSAPKPTRRAVEGELHVLELQLRNMLKARSELKAQLATLP